MPSQGGNMGDVKALLTLRYRPLSDTVVAFVDSLEGDAEDRGDLPNLEKGVVREKLDADTAVEWLRINRRDVLIGLQQMHASVNSYIEGMPPTISQLVTDLILLARDAKNEDDPQQDLLRTHEMKRRLDISLLQRPPQINEKRRASRETAKGVEASLSHVLDNLESAATPLQLQQPMYPALRDLVQSISDGEGLSSERAVDATFHAISKSPMPSQRRKTELLSLVNDLRDQRTWQSAIDKALLETEAPLRVDVDGADTDDV